MIKKQYFVNNKSLGINLVFSLVALILGFYSILQFITGGLNFQTGAKDLVLGIICFIAFILIIKFDRKYLRLAKSKNTIFEIHETGLLDKITFSEDKFIKFEEIEKIETYLKFNLKNIRPNKILIVLKNNKKIFIDMDIIDNFSKQEFISIVQSTGFKNISDAGIKLLDV